MKKLLFLIIAIAMVSVTYSQSVEIEGVRGLRFNGVHAISGGADMESEGFYTYYLLEKTKKMKTFEFVLIDKDVTKVLKTQVEMHKWADINNTVFNGKIFLISWVDNKNKNIVFNIFNLIMIGGIISYSIS